MKQRAREAKRAAAAASAPGQTGAGQGDEIVVACASPQPSRSSTGSGPGHPRRTGTLGGGRRWLTLGAGCALWIALGGSPAGRGIAVAEETTDPGAGRTALPAAKADEAKLKVAGKKGDKGKRPVAEAAPVAQPEAETGLAAELRGGNEAAAIAAARKLGAAQSATAADALLDALALGVTPKVAGAALDALATYKGGQGLGAQSSKFAEVLQVLAVYSHHRSPELRKRAVQALAALIAPPTAAAPAAPVAGKPAAKAHAAAAVKEPVAPPVAVSEQARVVPMLIAALSDSSAEVRAVAAEALGDRHEKTAEPALIKLLLRKDSSAPAALGKIGGADTARALSEMIGNVPDSFITETLGLLLLRSDFGPDPLRLEVVKTLGKLPGSQPIDILSDYVKDTGKDKADKARPSRTEANKIIEQRTAK